MFSGGYKKRSVAWNGLKGSVSKNWSSSSATLKTWDKFNKMSTAEFFEFPSKSSKTYNLFSLVSVTTLLWFIIQFIRNLDQGKSLIWKWRLYHSSQVTTWFKDLWCFFPQNSRSFIRPCHIFMIGLFSAVRAHSFSMYVKFFEKLTFLTPLIRTGTCVYQRVRNVSFSENLMDVLNEWLPKCYLKTFHYKCMAGS